jgi:hypothetical protein
MNPDPNRLRNEFFTFLVTLLLLAAGTLLLALRIIPPSDPIINSLFTTIATYWFLNSAFRWTPTVKGNGEEDTARRVSRIPPAPTVKVRRASAAYPSPVSSKEHEGEKPPHASD